MRQVTPDSSRRFTRSQVILILEEVNRLQPLEAADSPEVSAALLVRFNHSVRNACCNLALHILMRCACLWSQDMSNHAMVLQKLATARKTTTGMSPLILFFLAGKAQLSSAASRQSQAPAIIPPQLSLPPTMHMFSERISDKFKTFLSNLANPLLRLLAALGAQADSIQDGKRGCGLTSALARAWKLKDEIQRMSLSHLGQDSQAAAGVLMTLAGCAHQGAVAGLQALHNSLPVRLGGLLSDPEVCAVSGAQELHVPSQRR